MAASVSYDLFARGESFCSFKDEDHRRSLAQTIQALDAIRILDYMLSLKEADTAGWPSAAAPAVAARPS